MKDARKIRQKRNVFWLANAQFSHFSTQETAPSPFYAVTRFTLGNPVIRHIADNVLTLFAVKGGSKSLFEGISKSLFDVFLSPFVAHKAVKFAFTECLMYIINCQPNGRIP